MMEMFATSNYPKCDAVYWDKPVKESCSKCSMPFLLEKTTKKDGTVRYCQNDGSEYKMAVDITNASSSTKTEDTVSA